MSHHHFLVKDFKRRIKTVNFKIKRLILHIDKNIETKTSIKHLLFIYTYFCFLKKILVSLDYINYKKGKILVAEIKHLSIFNTLLMSFN